MKNKGPTIEPCGTLLNTNIGQKNDWFIFTICIFLWGSLFASFKTIPLMSICDSLEIPYEVPYRRLSRSLVTEWLILWRRCCHSNHRLYSGRPIIEEMLNACDGIQTRFQVTCDLPYCKLSQALVSQRLSILNKEDWQVRSNRWFISFFEDRSNSFKLLEIRKVPLLNIVRKIRSEHLLSLVASFFKTIFPMLSYPCVLFTSK